MKRCMKLTDPRRLPNVRRVRRALITTRPHVGDFEKVGSWVTVSPSRGSPVFHLTKEGVWMGGMSHVEFKNAHVACLKSLSLRKYITLGGTVSNEYLSSPC